MSNALTIPPDPWGVGAVDVAKGNYIRPIDQLKKMHAVYEGSKLRDTYLQVLATYMSFVGQPREALAYFDEFKGPTVSQTKVDLEDFSPVDAENYIIRISANRRALFINEAHHVPLHRNFTARLLKRLYALGYHYFAAETLNELDTELNVRRYPILHKTGFYTNESQGGQLIREALAIGFKVITYEHIPKCDPFVDPPEKCQNLRERGQAQNLSDRIFKVDPKAKILVHAGYGHIAKKGENKWVPMAVYFKQITGIDPISVDQVEFTEHSDAKYENSSFEKLSKTITRPTVFLSTKSLTASFQQQYDVQVIHPRTKLVNERPNWLCLGRRLVPVPRDMCQAKFPCLISANRSEEANNSVAVDQILVFHELYNLHLALPKGNYTILSKSENWETISERKVEAR